MARPRTAIRRLALQNFRNYEAHSLDLDGRHVVLAGANGAGKTNLLEAVSVIAPGRGLRSAEFASLGRDAGDGPSKAWGLSIVLQQGEDERRISLQSHLTPAGRIGRAARIDGEEATSTAVGEVLRVIWLTPAMDRVFAGGKTDRRRFFDRLVLAHAPNHGRQATAYEKALRERLAVLETGGDPAWLDALEARLSDAGAALTFARAHALVALRRAFDVRPEDAFPKADLDLAGEVEQAALDGADLGALKATLTEGFARARQTDARAGRSLYGPHRFDVETRHRPKNMPAAQCSTGEQKALLIGLVLANAQSLAGGVDTPDPILLLDEAAAHLDPERRSGLYDALSALPGQAWLTGTDAALFDAFGDRAQRFDVSGGRATPA